MLNVKYLTFYVPVLIGALWLTSCGYYQKSTLPDELDVGRVIHESEKTYWVGPSGLDKVFTVYSMSEDAAEKISTAGLPYLNNLPSTHDPKRDDSFFAAPPFLKWYTTPTSRAKTLNQGDSVPKRHQRALSLSLFFNNSEFISTIPNKIQEMYQQAANSPGGFYSYGGHRNNGAVIVSPSMRKVFYLNH